VRQLTILSGAGINLGVSAACPNVTEMINFTYQNISQNVYQRIQPDIRAMFSPESFDYILGGLLTINLVIEKTRVDLQRFQINETAFCSIFRQTDLQASIIEALTSIERQLTIPLDSQLYISSIFDSSVEFLCEKYNSINYFTVNFDNVFDHILYGVGYKRSGIITDFWSASGAFNESAVRKVKIHHLHGDLRFKPFKKTQYNNPPYKWPVIVVGDQEVKKGIIASNESLRKYHHKLKANCSERNGISENVLAIIGFGFREEDLHINQALKQAFDNGVYDKICLYNPEDKLGQFAKNYKWTQPLYTDLPTFLKSL